MKLKIVSTILLTALLASSLISCSTSKTIETKPFAHTDTSTVTTKAAESSSETTTTAPTPTPEPANTPAPTNTPKPTSTPKPTATPTPKPTVSSAFGTLQDINRVCSEKASCEKSIYVCSVDTESTKNPYDVKYDYGKEYQAYVDACDWSKIFDAKYYKKTFPMLALQYHNDDACLLIHFQTIGIHEGRQGSSKFNVGAYSKNCSSKIRDAFKNNYASYYIYYLLNYDKESSVNTKSAGKTKLKQQYAHIYTALQLKELNEVNEYRKKKKVSAVKLNSELCAFANYRAYLNSHDGYKAHDWAIKNDKKIDSCLKAMGSKNGMFGENTVTSYAHTIPDYAYLYYKSPEHYSLMVNKKYNCLGCSNAYYADKPKSVASQFDVYAKNLNTP